MLPLMKENDPGAHRRLRGARKTTSGPVAGSQAGQGERWVQRAPGTSSGQEPCVPPPMAYAYTLTTAGSWRMNLRPSKSNSEQTSRCVSTVPSGVGGLETLPIQGPLRHREGKAELKVPLP